MSALHIAVENGHTEVVEVLVHKMDKPDLNVRDNVSHIHTGHHWSNKCVGLFLSFAVWNDSTHTSHKEKE